MPFYCRSFASHLIYCRLNPQVVNKHQGKKTKLIKGLYHYLHKRYKTEQRKFMRKTFGQYPFSVTRFFEGRCSSLILETKTVWSRRVCATHNLGETSARDMRCCTYLPITIQKLPSEYLARVSFMLAYYTCD